MNIPPTADKWIVFLGTFGAAMVNYARITDLRFEPFIACELSVILATIVMIVYVAWSASVRWIARRVGRDTVPGYARMLSNASFLALALIIAILPIPKMTMRIDLPVRLHASPDGVTDGSP